ncbi:MAG: rod shape-determining protein MreC [Candidatus Hydrogenedentota bacterium]
MRRMRANRPEIVLAVMVGFSLFSLISGARAGFIGDFLRQTVSVTAYPFVKTMDWTGRAANYVLDGVFAYDRLRDDHVRMREQIARMKTNLANMHELRRENERLRDMLQFARNEPRLSLQPARVVENYRGILKIDQGGRHGIEEFMGVISEDGVVGVVIEAGYFTSTVATMHHVDCRIGAMVQHNRVRAYDGIIHAGGSNLNLFCTMDYIDLKEEVRSGDLVVTTPESLFPAGYPIGRVTATHGSGMLWKSAEIQPAVDPYRLDEVFVVKRAAPRTPELSGPVRVTPAENRAAPQPDDRSLQERYAP